MSEATQTSLNGEAPTWGERVEQWCSENLGLRLVDGTNYDARTSDGTPIQIKGTQRWTSNGPGERARGRFRLWEVPLLNLLADEGMYLLCVYDPGEHSESAEFVEAHAYKTPEVVGELARGKWSAAHRPEKGQQAKIRWTEVFKDGGGV